MIDQLQLGGDHSVELRVGPSTAVNALGFSAHQTWAFRRAELTGYGESPFRLPSGERATLSFVPTLPPTDFGGARLFALLDQALQPMAALLSRTPALRIGVALCVGPHLDGRHPLRRFSAERRQLQARAEALFAAQGLAPSWDLQARGHAGFGASLLWAARKLANRELDVAVVGGVDSYYDPDRMQQAMLDRRVFCAEQLDGFIPGEAASFSLLASAATLRQLELTARCRLETVSVGQEPAHPGSGLPCTGLGLSRTLMPASDRLRSEQRTLDWMLGDVTNEDYRAHELQLAFPRVVAGVVVGDLQLEFLPMTMGDLGAATLPTALAIVAEAFQRGDPRARTCLLFASSVGEDRAGILASALEER